MKKFLFALSVLLFTSSQLFSYVVKVRNGSGKNMLIKIDRQTSVKNAQGKILKQQDGWVLLKSGLELFSFDINSPLKSVSIHWMEKSAKKSYKTSAYQSDGYWWPQRFRIRAKGRYNVLKTMQTKSTENLKAKKEVKVSVQIDPKTNEMLIIKR